MATKGGSKMFWIIGGLIVVAGSVGAYLLLRKPKEEDGGTGDDTDTDTDTDTNVVNQGVSNQGGSNQVTYPAPKELDSFDKIKLFQNYVLTKDKSILGTDGADGLWGKRSNKAFGKYGKDYLKTLSNTTTPKGNKPSEKDIALIIKNATGFKSDKTMLQGKPASWVKDWAEAIRAKKTTFFWTKKEGGNNKTYKVNDGTILLNYVPIGTTYYASKKGKFSKEESLNSANAGYIQLGQDLGEARAVAYDGKYVYVYFPSKGGYKWVYESAITSKKPTSSFMGSDMDLDTFASFDNNLDLNL